MTPCIMPGNLPLRQTPREPDSQKPIAVHGPPPHRRITATMIAEPFSPEIAGVTSHEEKQVLKHKKNPELGNKITLYDPVVYLEQADAQTFGDNEEITLMDWGNVFVRSKKTGKDDLGLLGRRRRRRSIRAMLQKGGLFGYVELVSWLH